VSGQPNLTLSFGEVALVESSFRGGARIGWVNASWPFATLKITDTRLAISTLSSYEFSPEQVVSVERYGSIPVLSSGIRINHNRADYPKKVVFWCVGNREKVFAQIKKSGFLPKGQKGIRAKGLPIRWSVVIAAILLWNALFILDRSLGIDQWREPGLFAIVALLLVLIFSTAVRISTPAQQFVLREGHHMGEIKAFVALLQLVSAVLSVGFGISFLARTYAGYTIPHRPRRSTS